MRKENTFVQLGLSLIKQKNQLINKKLKTFFLSKNGIDFKPSGNVTEKKLQSRPRETKNIIFKKWLV